MTAFKYISESNDVISFEKLLDILKEEGLDEYAAEMVLKQVGEWETDN